MIRLPVHVGELLGRIMKSTESFVQDFNREPTQEELAELLGVTEETIRNTLRAAPKPTSLEMPVGEDEDGYLKDLIQGEELYPTDKTFDQINLTEEVKELLNGLNDKERRVIILRFGLNGESELTLEEVGAEFGVTRERIRQIEKKALKKLGRRTRGKKLHDYLIS